MPRAFAATALLTSAVAPSRSPMSSSIALFGLLTSRMSHAGSTIPSARAGASDVQRIRFVIAASSEAHTRGERNATRNRHLPAVGRIEEVAVEAGRAGAAVAAAIECVFRIHSRELIVDPERQVASAEAELCAGQSPTVDEGRWHTVRQ